MFCQNKLKTKKKAVEITLKLYFKKFYKSSVELMNKQKDLEKKKKTEVHFSADNYSMALENASNQQLTYFILFYGID